MNPQLSDFHKKAQLALRQKAYEQAHRYCLLILKNDPRFADAWFLLAMIAAEHGQASKAIELIAKALSLAGTNAEYLTQLARCKVMLHDHVGALQSAAAAEQLKPASAFLLDTLGVIYSHIGMHHKSAELFKQAVEMDTGQLPGFRYNLATALNFIGDFNGARKALEHTIEIAPNAFEAHWKLSGMGGIDIGHNHIKRLNALKHKAQSADDKLYIGHALAKEYELLGDFEASFKALDWCKQAKLAQIDYDFAGDEMIFDCLNKAFSSSGVLSHKGCDNDEAIFVVGMPRTGTTLLERILTNHKDVCAAGEMQHFSQVFRRHTGNLGMRLIDPLTIEAAKNVDYAQLGKDYIQSTRALTGNSKKFVDKMPLNALYVGFIVNALPNCKILCLDRDPMDTIVSNYRQLFASNQGYYDYAYSLKSAAQYYLKFKALIKLWQRLYPNNFKVVSYEKLVSNPSAQAQDVMNFCGLDWQSDCLNIAKNDNAVATASSNQVRKGIYTDSIGAWRKYQDCVGEALKVLDL